MKKREKGMMLLETIVALALLGIIGVAFLSALATTSSARATSSERSAAKILAENLMEQIKNLEFAASYTADVTIPAEYTGFSPEITVQSMENGGIQKITVAVSRSGRGIYAVETYKTDR